MVQFHESSKYESHKARDQWCGSKRSQNADVTLTDCKSILPYQIGVLDSGSKGVRISPAALVNFTYDSTFLTGRYKRVGISRLGKNRRRYVPDLSGGNRVIRS